RCSSVRPVGIKRPSPRARFSRDSRTPLTPWLRAMWWLTNQKTGVSALGLQRTFGLRSYKTAWTWLHKLRRAMVRPGRNRLTGRGEVDEAYIGGVHPGRRGRQTETKALIAVAVQVERRRLGRIRLRRIPDASAASLMAFVQDADVVPDFRHDPSGRGPAVRLIL